MSTPAATLDELTPKDLGVIVCALELLRDQVRDRPLDPVLPGEHQEAYLAKSDRINEVEQIIPKVRYLAREVERLGSAEL